MTVQTLRFARAGEVEVFGTEGAEEGEGVILLLPIDEIGIGDGRAFESGGLEIDRVELVRLRERKRIEEYAVDYGEERGVCADAQSEGEDGDDREAGIFL